MIVPPCAVVVSPLEGRVRRVVPPGTLVRDGEVVGMVEGSGAQADLHAPVTGHVGGLLAEREQPVAKGEGVLWLSRR